MARPKVFVSSTYYDLRHIRSNIEIFLADLGYDAVLFENGSVIFDPGMPLDESCYEEVKGCDIFVLIVGGRYGSIASAQQGKTQDLDATKERHLVETLNSVTKTEYLTARKKDVPIYIFVEKAVAAEYRTYQKNRGNKKIKYAHVDSVGIFSLLDDIYREARNNLVREFEKASDIESWLRDQWAGLFAHFIRARTAQTELHDLASQLTELKAINEGLKNYSEAIMKRLQVAGADKVIEAADKKIFKVREDDFLTSPMIGYFIKHASQKKIPIRIREWAPKFKAASSPEEFLEAVGFSLSDIEEIKGRVGGLLKQDFAQYQKRYFNNEHEFSQSKRARGDDRAATGKSIALASGHGAGSPRGSQTATSGAKSSKSGKQRSSGGRRISKAVSAKKR